MENNELDNIKGKYITVDSSELPLRNATPSELKAAKILSQKNQNKIIRMMAFSFALDVILVLITRSFMVFSFLTAFTLLLAIPLSNSYKSSLHVTRGMVISKRIRQKENSPEYLVTVEINETHIICEDIVCGYKNDYDRFDIDSEALIVNLDSNIVAIYPPDESGDNPAIEDVQQK